MDLPDYQQYVNSLVLAKGLPGIRAEVCSPTKVKIYTGPDMIACVSGEHVETALDMYKLGYIAGQLDGLG